MFEFPFALPKFGGLKIASFPSLTDKTTIDTMIKGQIQYAPLLADLRKR